MTWPYEDRLAYYDAWVAVAVLATLAGAGLALELAPMGEARAASRRIAATMSSSEPTPGEAAVPVAAVEREARDRLRRAGDRLRGCARRLARPAAATEPDDAGAPIRRRIRTDALRAALGGGSLATDDTLQSLSLAELVVQRLGESGLGPERIRALRVVTSLRVPRADPVATGSARTEITLAFVVPPRLLGPALARLRDPDPRLLLERLAIAGGEASELLVHLELAQLEVSLGGDPVLPRSHRDPEEGWIADEPPVGGRW